MKRPRKSLEGIPRLCALATLPVLENLCPVLRFACDLLGLTSAEYQHALYPVTPDHCCMMLQESTSAEEPRRLSQTIVRWVTAS